ncbi:MAG: hypothetical protein ACC618_04565 [Patescibacteria group bacterium]
MSNSPLVVVDADAIIAQSNPRDSNYKKAISISENLQNLQTHMLYPITAIGEATAFMQRVLKSSATAYGMATVFLDPQYELVDITQDIYVKAVEGYFSSKASNKDTLFDCFVASIAEKYHADAIFSFDKYYKKNGFKLASEL